MGWCATIKLLLLSFWRHHMGLPQEENAAFSLRLQHPGELLKGRASRWIKFLNKEQHESFFNTILIGLKGGLPRPDESCLKESVDAWKAELFITPRKEMTTEQKLVQLEVRQIVLEYFKDKGRVEPRDILNTPKVPSTSANYVNSRTKFGAVGTFLDDKDFQDYINNNAHLGTYDVEYEPSDVYDHTKNRFVNSNRMTVNTEKLRMHYAGVVELSYKKARAEEPLVQAVALSEALKVRMITKCPPFLMFFMNACIDPLRKELKRDTVFRLTGEPISESIMDEVFPNGGRNYLSGDYKASTDKIYSWVSETIVDALCDGYYQKVTTHFPEFRKLFKKSLTGFKTWEKEIDPKSDIKPDQQDRGRLLDQQRGQLMGSVSSFPVLCLANYALCTLAMRQNPPNWRKNLLINGDDCVFEANDACKAEWERIGNLMGLEPSPGKVDYSSTRLQMNSRTFVPDRSARPYHYGFFDSKMKYQVYPEARWRRVPLMLFGVALGQVRSASADKADELNLTILDRAAALKDYMYELVSPTDSQIAYFNRCSQSLIKRVVKNNDLLRWIPWNVPTHLGGWGLKGEVSDLDLHIVYYIHKSGKTFPTAKEEKQWLIHDELMKAMKTSYYEPSVLPLDEESRLGALYWFAFVNLLSKSFRHFSQREREDRANKCRSIRILEGIAKYWRNGPNKIRSNMSRYGPVRLNKAREYLVREVPRIGYRIEDTFVDDISLSGWSTSLDEHIGGDVLFTQIPRADWPKLDRCDDVLGCLKW